MKQIECVTTSGILLRLAGSDNCLASFSPSLSSGTCVSRLASLGAPDDLQPPSDLSPLCKRACWQIGTISWILANKICQTHPERWASLKQQFALKTSKASMSLVSTLKSPCALKHCANCTNNLFVFDFILKFLTLCLKLLQLFMWEATFSVKAVKSLFWTTIVGLLVSSLQILMGFPHGIHCCQISRRSLLTSCWRVWIKAYCHVFEFVCVYQPKPNMSTF